MGRPSRPRSWLCSIPGLLVAFLSSCPPSACLFVLFVCPPHAAGCPSIASHTINPAQGHFSLGAGWNDTEGVRYSPTFPVRIHLLFVQVYWCSRYPVIAGLAEGKRREDWKEKQSDSSSIIEPPADRRWSARLSSWNPCQCSEPRPASR